MENKMYCVRFVRIDGQPDEEYHYWHREDAEQHLKVFQDDDSGLYERIELVVIAGGLSSVLTTMKFVAA
jgi:hypothetical protein